MSPCGYVLLYPKYLRATPARPGTTQGALVADLVVIPDPPRRSDVLSRTQRTCELHHSTSRLRALYDSAVSSMRFLCLGWYTVCQALIWLTGIPLRSVDQINHPSGWHAFRAVLPI